MESRFGHDFSQVQIHNGTQAAESANAVNAAAYTVGNHLVFGAGQYTPGTKAGQSLLAHELVHVIQQSRNPVIQPGQLKVRQRDDQPERAAERAVSLWKTDGPMLQRMRFGQGTPPNWGPEFQLDVVPDEDRPRVNAAIRLVRTVVEDPQGYDDCHRFFAEHCPGGEAATMSTTFNQAILWKLTETSGDELARGQYEDVDIAYSQRGYDRGENSLAVTLVHEMMHNCGIRTGDEHHLADVAGLYCIGAPNIIFSTLGVSLTGGQPDFIAMISYRRILEAWASGRIQLTTGGDLNFYGLTSEAITAIRGVERSPGEFASAMVGLRGRTNLIWGGERFGGLTGSIETGVGVGRFLLRDLGPGEEPTSVEGDVVLQVGIGAEFYLPVGQGATPVSIEAAYRLVQPLDDEARRIHGFVITLGAHRE
jgi:hypothetical protein